MSQASMPPCGKSALSPIITRLGKIANAKPQPSRSRLTTVRISVFGLMQFVAQVSNLPYRGFPIRA
jgi:hypothetical protein